MEINDLLKEEISTQPLNEWTGKIGSKEITLYAKPLSPYDVSQIERHDKTFTSNPTFDGFVRAIMLKAIDEDGKRVFNKESLALLSRLGVSLIGDISASLFGNQFDSEDFNLEDIEKN